MALDGSALRWPGVDRDRAVAALWHLERAATRLRGIAAREVVVGRPVGFTVAGRRLMRQADEHARIARGFLGAVGFEHGGRLEVRA